jgi:putative ABC transport system substrate-binding protein
MRRRAFLAMGTGVILSRPLASLAQPRPKLIGYLAPGIKGPRAIFLRAFTEGMRSLGYSLESDYLLEERYAEGEYDRLPKLAEELVARKVDVLVTVASPAIRAAQRATSSIPIVMAFTGDAVASGLVTSLAKPGGNTTGISHIASGLAQKHLDLVLSVAPRQSAIGLLTNPNSSSSKPVVEALEEAAQHVRINLAIVQVRSPAEINGSVEALVKQNVTSFIAVADAMINLNLHQFADAALKYKMASIYEYREYADLGGLMSYGPDLFDSMRRSATFVDKIFRGAAAGEIPIEQPTKFDFVVNLRTATTLGIVVPPPVLAGADEVIE